MPKKAKKRPRPTITRSAYLGGRTRTRDQRLFDAYRDVLGGTSDEDRDAMPDVLERAIRSGRKLADRLASFQKGRGARPVAWQAVARALYKQTPVGRGRATRVWDRLVEIADGEHDVIHEAFTTEERSTCPELGCAKGQHLHCRVRAGDVLIQRGTYHAWSNRSDRICRMLFVLIDAEPT